jgi:quercetin dioxygenase-like cupin family protein
MNASQFVTAAAFAIGALAAPWAMAHGNHADPSAEEKVTEVQLQKLADVPGKQGIMVVVDYLPGQASEAHSHSGSVFAYVLEGEIESQLGGQRTAVYKAGQSWYEPPGSHHLVSRNASKTRPAKLLAFILANEGGQVKEPLPKK